MPRGQIEETENSIRIALTDDKDYDGFRTIRLTSGVKLLLGISGDKSTPVTLIFDKSKYSTDEAKKWFESRKDEFGSLIKKALELETAKAELFGLLIDDIMTSDNFVEDIENPKEESMSHHDKEKMLDDSPWMREMFPRWIHSDTGVQVIVSSEGDMWQMLVMTREGETILDKKFESEEEAVIAAKDYMMESLSGHEDEEDKDEEKMTLQDVTDMLKRELERRNSNN